tara:strand:+ start:964 stop:1119 length:156 start_codon:yes stop_codon:yes gene_type:complete
MRETQKISRIVSSFATEEVLEFVNKLFLIKTQATIIRKGYEVKTSQRRYHL